MVENNSEFPKGSLINEIDFSKRREFPGENGNVLDVILRKLNRIEAIPPGIFAVILLFIAIVPTFGKWELTTGLWGFFILDWLLLSSLPKFNISYGPSQPPVFLLAIPRALAAFFPLHFALAFQLAGTFLVIYGFFLEPSKIVVTIQSLESPKLTEKKPLRLLHLGDLHIEHITSREIELNRQIKTLKPDVIVFSGDVLNLSYLNDKTSWHDARKVISEWEAPLGVFSVSGSPAVDLEEIMPELMQGLPLHWLRNEKITLNWHGDSIDLIGLNCSHRPHIDSLMLSSLAEPDNNRLSILLYHTPDLAPASARVGIDLQLSGHTHGGQVRLPWYGALLSGSLYGKLFESGRHMLGKMTLYVTRGIGMEGEGAPRVRFLCPPEIILWEISACGRNKLDQVRLSTSLE